MGTMPTITVMGLYQLATGDTASHQRRIDARFRKLDERTQRVIRARIAGGHLRDIAAAEGVSFGTISKVISRGLERIRKSIAGEPRYNRSGRGAGAAQN